MNNLPKKLGMTKFALTLWRRAVRQLSKKLPPVGRSLDGKSESYILYVFYWLLICYSLISSYPI